MSKTNVLHIIDNLGIGGAEKVMIGTVNSLPELQHHVAFLKGSEALASYLPPSCRVKKLNYRGKIDIFRAALELRRYIRKNNISIVHSHLVLSTLVARLACPRDVKLFTTIHNLPSQSYFADRPLARLMEKLTYKKRHHMIAICNEVFEDYHGCIGIKGPYTILYNYVEGIYQAESYKRMEKKDTLRLIAVGNLKPQKNYSYLVEAFKQLPSNIHLDIFGSGPLREQLQAEIDRHKLNIRLCGVREDIHNILPRYDAFIMSSLFEGQPIALLEAMSCGIPALLSDIPVLREVTNSQAVFFDINDTNDFVKKIKSVANHEIDLDVYAEAGFDRVRKIANKENYMMMIRKLYLEHSDYRIRANHDVVRLFRPRYPSPA